MLAHPQGPARLLGLSLAALLLAACGGGSKEAWSPGKPVTLQVGAWFPAGTQLTDAASGTSLTVSSGGTVTVAPGADGLALLERADAVPSGFAWKNATVYFAVTDRFFDGDPANNGSYGRTGDGAQEIGTWHGGDLAGLTQKLDYLAGLGVTAIWISPPVEQVHGWVSGGTGDFQHYGYAGYWALDFTRLDANFGTPAELQAFVDGAHQRGMRVLLDVVMNHPGYATGADLVAYLPEVFRDGTGDAFLAWVKPPASGWDAWNALVNYASPGWSGWWSPAWIRAGLGPTTAYAICGKAPDPPCTDLTLQQAFLPDFRTEQATVAGVPPFFARKADTGVVEIPGGTVRDYLVAWHADWVRQYGIDGFRCDTAKHVELASWKALKDAGVAALAEWKAANPAKAPDGAPFWTTAEVFPHGVVKDQYYTEGGFDSVINFDFQRDVGNLLKVSTSLLDQADALDAIYAGMATALAGDPAFDVLSYLSSHDTSLLFAELTEDAVRQREAGAALLMAPGGVQIFYGDESGRRLGPAGSDATQGTRSDMNWSSIDASIHDAWAKLGTFRRDHAAVGTGAHARIDSPRGTYAFARSTASDAVVVLVARTR
jgi:alpha-amylase